MIKAGEAEIKFALVKTTMRYCVLSS